MNKKMIAFIVGRILLLEAGLMVLPLIISFIYRETLKYKVSYFSVIVILLILGFVLSARTPKDTSIQGREGFVIVSLSWILLSFFGALPLFMTKEVLSFTDSFFEIVSGFTTTGSSVITDLSKISRSNLFWRSFTHFVGGMGVLVLALAVFPKNSPSSVHVMKAEVPGPTFGKLVSKLSTTARVLYKIYVVMTIVLTVLLVFGGLDIFEAALIAFGTAGTGGFGVRNGSILPYNSAYVEMVLAVGMLVFGVNFNVYYYILIKKIKEAFANEELKYYLITVFMSTVFIFINIVSKYNSLWQCFRDVFFSVSSIITTTGYSTADFGSWPVFSQTILLILMFFGACAGSTAGGLKISRIVMIGKMFSAEIKHMVSPNRVISVKYENKTLDVKIQKSVTNYFLVYMVLFVVMLFIIAANTDDFLTAFSAVAATFNNIGPGLGKVGPTLSYTELNNLSKIVLSFAMLAGRLEIFPMLVLFAPGTWKIK
ncbi:TrkH family potassium uptake protein [Leptotrichia sp. OH3620_COT-345]|uniref:TrkH family potassium uptake protein n=1 Tax=Leptotrichia sp. OH3620_COT-345 TaxID=2491048 RepID=UPI000F648E57|nr:TrkH family potassium uptake protein [Leptotrichia sp. OH3620_COT-345]RRD40517.1 TrkH family potassium uptake protein [Leptotrichia sp. OH3620_COT-345]